MAKKYVQHFSANKVELANLLFRLYNEEIFLRALDPKTEIVWKPNLLKTAGTCCYRTKWEGNKKIRYCTINLATKVLDSADRLRDTLIHEMCHQATFIISGISDGHGVIWKDWAKRYFLIILNQELLQHLDGIPNSGQVFIFKTIVFLMFS